MQQQSTSYQDNYQLFSLNSIQHNIISKFIMEINQQQNKTDQLFCKATQQQTLANINKHCKYCKHCKTNTINCKFANLDPTFSFGSNRITDSCLDSELDPMHSYYKFSKIYTYLGYFNNPYRQAQRKLSKRIINYQPWSMNH